MTAQSDSGTSIFDVIKLVFSIVLVIGGVVAFYYFADQSLLYRVLGLVALAIVAILIVFSTAVGKKLWAFIHEARTEVRRVIWPTKQETTQTTLIVVVMVFIVGIFLWLLDMFLFWGVRVLTGQGG